MCRNEYTYVHLFAKQMQLNYDMIYIKQNGPLMPTKIDPPPKNSHFLNIKTTPLIERFHGVAHASFFKRTVRLHSK